MNEPPQQRHLHPPRNEAVSFPINGRATPLVTAELVQEERPQDYPRATVVRNESEDEPRSPTKWRRRISRVWKLVRRASNRTQSTAGTSLSSQASAAEVQERERRRTRRITAPPTELRRHEDVTAVAAPATPAPPAPAPLEREDGQEIATITASVTTATCLALSASSPQEEAPSPQDTPASSSAAQQQQQQDSEASTTSQPSASASLATRNRRPALSEDFSAFSTVSHHPSANASLAIRNRRQALSEDYSASPSSPSSSPPGAYRIPGIGSDENASSAADDQQESSSNGANNDAARRGQQIDFRIAEWRNRERQKQEQEKQCKDRTILELTSSSPRQAKRKTLGKEESETSNKELPWYETCRPTTAPRNLEREFVDPKAAKHMVIPLLLRLAHYAMLPRRIPLVNTTNNELARRQLADVPFVFSAHDAGTKSSTKSRRALALPLASGEDNAGAVVPYIPNLAPSPHESVDEEEDGGEEEEEEERGPSVCAPIVVSARPTTTEASGSARPGEPTPQERTQQASTNSSPIDVAAKAAAAAATAALAAAEASSRAATAASEAAKAAAAAAEAVAAISRATDAVLPNSVPGAFLTDSLSALESVGMVPEFVSCSGDEGSIDSATSSVTLPMAIAREPEQSASDVPTTAGSSSVKRPDSCGHDTEALSQPHDEPCLDSSADTGPLPIAQGQTSETGAQGAEANSDEPDPTENSCEGAPSQATESSHPSGRHSSPNHAAGAGDVQCTDADAAATNDKSASASGTPARRVSFRDSVEPDTETLSRVKHSCRSHKAKVCGSNRCHVDPSRLRWSVLESIWRFKQCQKLILVDHLVGDLQQPADREEVVEALRILSEHHEIRYYDDPRLSEFIVLSPSWEDTVVRELADPDRLRAFECSRLNRCENEVTEALVSDMSCCPLLSDEDIAGLCKSVDCAREVLESMCQLPTIQSADATPCLVRFIKQRLVYSGIFKPLNIAGSHCFVPGMLLDLGSAQNEVWTFKSRSWETTLCHKWHFSSCPPVGLMDDLIVAVLEKLNVFVQKGPSPRTLTPLRRARTAPLLRSVCSGKVPGRENVLESVHVRQICAWQSVLRVKVGTVSHHEESGKKVESSVEVFVALVDNTSPYCIASEGMHGGMSSLVVSGRGQAGLHGRRLWEGGYQIVLEAVQSVMAERAANAVSRVACPECLKHLDPPAVQTWDWQTAQVVGESAESKRFCGRGHHVDMKLVCGNLEEKNRFGTPIPGESTPGLESVVPVQEMLPGVVLICAWDKKTNAIGAGSGFVVDKELGLIVTAAHVLFNMENGSDGFGTLSLPNAEILIGVMPEGQYHAEFRYYADIVAADIDNIDACVLRVREGLGNVKNEALPHALRMTCRCQLEEPIRIMGINQGGEGLFEPGSQLNRTPDLAKGYICGLMPTSDCSRSSSDSSRSFMPRQEIIAMCHTISGHSGGPCVTDQGKVAGILSRADPVNPKRCYLVPSNEIHILVRQATMNARADFCL